MASAPSPSDSLQRPLVWVCLCLRHRHYHCPLGYQAEISVCRPLRHKCARQSPPRPPEWSSCRPQERWSCPWPGYGGFGTINGHCDWKRRGFATLHVRIFSIESSKMTLRLALEPKASRIFSNAFKNTTGKMHEDTHILKARYIRRQITSRNRTSPSTFTCGFANGRVSSMHMICCGEKNCCSLSVDNTRKQ